MRPQTVQNLAQLQAVSKSLRTGCGEAQLHGQRIEGVRSAGRCRASTTNHVAQVQVQDRWGSGDPTPSYRHLAKIMERLSAGLSPRSGAGALLSSPPEVMQHLGMAGAMLIAIPPDQQAECIQQREHNIVQLWADTSGLAAQAYKQTGVAKGGQGTSVTGCLPAPCNPLSWPQS